MIAIAEFGNWAYRVRQENCETEFRAHKPLKRKRRRIPTIPSLALQRLVCAVAIRRGVKPSKNNRSREARNCLFLAAAFSNSSSLAISFIFFGKTTGLASHDWLRRRSDAAQDRLRRGSGIRLVGGSLNLDSEIFNYVQNIVLEVVLILHVFLAGDASARPSHERLGETAFPRIISQILTIVNISLYLSFVHRRKSLRRKALRRLTFVCVFVPASIRQGPARIAQVQAGKGVGDFGHRRLARPRKRSQGHKTLALTATG